MQIKTFTLSTLSKVTKGCDPRKNHNIPHGCCIIYMCPRVVFRVCDRRNIQKESLRFEIRICWVNTVSFSNSLYLSP